MFDVNILILLTNTEHANLKKVIILFVLHENQPKPDNFWLHNNMIFKTNRAFDYKKVSILLSNLI